MKPYESPDELALFTKALLDEWPDANTRPHPVAPLAFMYGCVQSRWEGWCLARELTAAQMGVPALPIDPPDPHAPHE